MHHYIEAFDEPATDGGAREPADLDYWSGLSESYQPEWYFLHPCYQTREGLTAT